MTQPAQSERVMDSTQSAAAVLTADKRDWFAGQALAGLLASGTYNNSGVGFAEHIADRCGEIADAMMAERAKAAS